MTLTEMRYIVALARERHFGRAAEKCHVSQPTLSIAVQKVEKRFRVTLFERSAADVRLTDLGEQIAQQAEKVLEEANRLREITEQGKDPLLGPLRLGVIYTIAPYLLPRLIPALNQRAPKMPLYLQENFTVNLTAQLRRGDLDAIIVALPFDEAGIVWQKVYEEPFCVVTPAAHPLAARTLIDPDDVAGANLLLLGSGNCFRDQVVQACPQLAAPGGTDGTREGSSLETVRYMVASGAGVAVMPSTAADPLVDKEAMVRVLSFSREQPSRTVGLVWRVTFPRPQAIDAVRAALLSCQLPGATAVH
ncbi:MAG TPA: hydrogen peroxide-inducible genes activator [Accumulibacter sp.]|nr:hydrogen peroxide-inducible genes activator [Accumulibacter sp.]